MADIFNGNSNSLVSGTSGNDYIDNHGRHVLVNSGKGNDTICNYVGGVSVSGYEANYSSLLAGAGNDYIDNHGNHSLIDGGKGNDTICNYVGAYFDDEANYSTLLGGEDNIVIGLKVEVNGDLDGMMLHVVEKRFAERIINTFYAKEIDNIANLDEMDSSVLNEMANITSGAYANSIATLTSLFVNIGTPNQIPGKVSEIIKLPLNEFVKPGEKVLVVDEEFTIDDEHISSNMILALESESLEKLFSRLGVEL